MSYVNILSRESPRIGKVNLPIGLIQVGLNKVSGIIDLMEQTKCEINLYLAI